MDILLKLLEGLIPGLIVIAVLFKVFSGFFRGASSDPVSREYLGLPQEEIEQERIRTILERRVEQRRRQAQETVENVVVTELSEPGGFFQGIPGERPEPVASVIPLPTANPPLLSDQIVVSSIGVRPAFREATIRGKLGSRRGLRQAILISEILGSPRGYRSFDEEHR